MQDALYGPAGFYRTGAGPESHFRTSVTASRLFAAAVARLATTVDDQLSRPSSFAVVDVGAGDGSLLHGLLAGLDDDRRARWRLVGVDLRGRPAGLPDAVDWSDQVPADVGGLLVAHELLDNVPLDVVEQTAQGPRLLAVDSDGVETQAGPPAPPDAEWLARWWPLDGATPGDRAEIGRPRDDLWADLVGRVSCGLAVAVDYAHTREERATGRWAAGTLTGYRDGHQAAAVPDGSTDLTAHVALDACAEAGLRAGATDSLLASQREVLGWLGVDATRPPLALSHTDPVGYVRRLGQASEAAELLQPGGLGGFGWLVQATGCAVPKLVRGH